MVGSEILLPPPQRLVLTGGSVTLGATPALEPGPDSPPVMRAIEKLEHALRASDVPTGDSKPLRLTVSPEASRGPESYRLELSQTGISVVAGGEAGLAYGLTTLTQLVDGLGRRLPAMRVDDWPDFPVRGAMLDVSRDRVPTMESLLALVDRLASWKLNQLQLYMEHTFAYRGHEVVWRDASPFTPEEIRRLDAFCRRRNVELVPSQNSFGHMHRWLIHEPYRSLAECPDGVDHPFSPGKEPFGLCPTDPRSLELLADLYDQLLPNFSSKSFNVGLDETFDLGLGRSARLCQERGTARVYLEFLDSVHRLVTDRGRRMQFWGDIILKEPALLGELPRDAVALEWGYEADHPFERHARQFAAAGLEFFVCPGTSSWNAVAGRTDNALANIAAAASVGHDAGAGGLLVTDWGDNGHLQPPPVSLPGLLAAAAFSWNVPASRAPRDLPFADLLDRHAFEDRRGAMGRAALELGTCYRDTGVLLRNSTVLSKLLLAPGAWPTDGPRGLTSAGLQQTSETIAAARARIARADMARADGALISEEYRWVCDAMSLACDLGRCRLESGLDRPLSAASAASRRALAPRTADLIAAHRTIWLRRSRPGGLEDSAGRLRRTLAQLEL
jgi:hypothetical protein